MDLSTTFYSLYILVADNQRVSAHEPYKVVTNFWSIIKLEWCDLRSRYPGKYGFELYNNMWLNIIYHPFIIAEFDTTVRSHL